MNMILTLSILLVMSVGWVITCLSIPQLKNLINSPGFLSLFYQLAIAYVITFVFYFLAIYLEERRNIKNIDAYVIPRSQNVIGDGYFIFNDLVKKANISDPEFPPSEEEVRKILEKIDPNETSSPMVNYNLQKLNWIDYLNSQKLRSQNFIKNIFYRMPYLDTGLIKILTKIDDSDYFNSLNQVAYSSQRGQLKNQDLTFFTSVLFSYFNDIDELQKFIETHYNKPVKYNELFKGVLND